MSKPKIDALSKIIEYHEDVYKLYDSYKEAFSLVQQNELELFWSKFIHFSTTDLKNHFKFEELIIFKSLQGAKVHSNVKIAINTLQEEHTCMLNITNTLLIIKQYEASAENIESIKSMLAELFRKLLVHAQLEDTLIVPLLKKRTDIQVSVGREFLKNRWLLKSNS